MKVETARELGRLLSPLAIVLVVTALVLVLAGGFDRVHDFGPTLGGGRSVVDYLSSMLGR